MLDASNGSGSIFVRFQVLAFPVSRVGDQVDGAKRIPLSRDETHSYRKAGSHPDGYTKFRTGGLRSL